MPCHPRVLAHPLPPRHTDHDGATRAEVLSRLAPWRFAYVVTNGLILLICAIAIGLAAAAVTLNGWPAPEVAWEAYGVGGVCSVLGLLAIIGLYGAHHLKTDLQVATPPSPPFAVR